MPCTRCGGLLVAEILCADGKVSWGLDLPITRCLNCGNIEDPVILWHRVIQLSTGQAAESTEDIEGTQSDWLLN